MYQLPSHSGFVDPRPMRCRQDGQITVVFAVLASVLVMLGGLAYDGAHIFNAKREASILALGAARAGAQALAVSSMYEETPELFIDLSLAEMAVADYLDQHDDWSISIRGNTISTTVWLTQPLRILSAFGFHPRRVAGTATARIVRGISSGDEI